MSNDRLAFGPFLLESSERRLSRDGTPVELSGRYLDALLLLARHPGELITKDRFMAEVWRGIPVTDEALTQCVRNLRKVLGDEAARPRFIETVPRHGYRFVAAVAGGSDGRDETTSPARASATSDPDAPMLPKADPASVELARRSSSESRHDLKRDSTFKSGADPVALSHAGLGADDRERAPEWSGAKGRMREWLLVAASGLAGGAAAGLVGGIGYGLLAATDPPAGTGAISILLVLTCLSVLVGLVGGLGVAAGSALGRLLGPGRLFPVMAGGALGGLVVGSLGRLIGLDAFSLLIGSRPLAITGGSEGLLIGALAGAGLWWAERHASASLERVASVGGLLGAMAGLLVGLSGGTMMAGSLAALTAAHPDAPLGRLLGQLPPSLLLTAGAVEGAIFLGALTLSFALALRARNRT